MAKQLSDRAIELLVLINVFGSDFNILRSLHAKGLISRPQTSLTNKYVFLITEDGSLAIETYREAGHRLFA